MDKDTKCLNCDKIFTGYFCPQCGQPAQIARITIGYVWREIQRVLFYRDAGVYYTIISLITRPGHMIREYLESKRARHYKPFYLFFYLSAIYILLISYLGIDKIELYHSDPTTADFEKFIGKYYGLINLLGIPFFAFSSYIFFRKFKLFFGEHSMLNMYVRLLNLNFNFILIPFKYFFITYRDYSMDFFFNRSMLISLLVSYYAFYQFFLGINFWEKTIRFLAFYLFSYTLIQFIVIAIVLIYYHQKENLN